MTTNRPGHSGAVGNDDVLQRAMRALDGNRLHEAEQIARDVLNADQRNAKALYVLGSALLMQGRPLDAIAPLEDAAPWVECSLSRLLPVRRPSMSVHPP